MYQIYFILCWYDIRLQVTLNIPAIGNIANKTTNWPADTIENHTNLTNVIKNHFWSNKAPLSSFIFFYIVLQLSDGFWRKTFQKTFIWRKTFQKTFIWRKTFQKTFKIIQRNVKNHQKLFSVPKWFRIMIRKLLWVL